MDDLSKPKISGATRVIACEQKTPSLIVTNRAPPVRHPNKSALSDLRSRN